MFHFQIYGDLNLYSQSYNYGSFGWTGTHILPMNVPNVGNVLKLRILTTSRDNLVITRIQVDGLSYNGNWVIDTPYSSRRRRRGRRMILGSVSYACHIGEWTLSPSNGFSQQSMRYSSECIYTAVK